MNKIMTGRRHIFFALMVIVAAWGCATEEEKIEKHFKNAARYISQEDYESAVIEFKNIIQFDPENDNAHFELGETYLKLNEVDLAAQSFANAIKSNQEHLEAHLTLGNILLAAGKPMGARKAARSVLDKNPYHLNALQLLAAVQKQENNLVGAIKTLERAIGVAPGNIAPRLILASFLESEGKTDEAEKVYEEVITISPSEPKAYIALAYLYAEREAWEKARTVLQWMFQASSPKLHHLDSFAHYCEKHRKWDLALGLFETAAKNAAPGNPMALVALGDHHARRGDYDKALDFMSKASVEGKDEPAIWAKIGSLHVDLGNIDDAETAADRALSLDGSDAVANYVKGRIHYINKEFTEALHRFDQSLREAPDNAFAYYYRAMCLMGKGTRGLPESDLFRAAAGFSDDEEGWIQKNAHENLVKAVELNPNFLKARLFLADLYLKQRNTEKARAHIHEALALAPGYLGTLALKGSLDIMEGNLNQAEILCKKVLAEYPGLSDWHSRLGVVYSALNRPADALDAYGRALELDPMAYDAFRSMVYIHLSAKRYEDALTLCAKHKGRVKKSRIELARIENMEGLVFLAQGNKERAIASYNKAVANAPDFISPRMALAGIYARSGKADRAIVQCEKILSINSEYLPACMLLGNIYYLGDDKDMAEKYYRQALAIDRRHGPAANNLAYILSVKDDKLREAFQLARLAAKEMPGDAGARDTLGWLHYRIGNYQKAIGYFEKSLSIDPQNPLANYHLGLAYYQNNDFERARDYIKKSLALDPDFEGADEARAMLDK